MSRTVSLEVFLLSLLSGAVLCYAEASTQCGPRKFKCANGKCISTFLVCNQRYDCRDNSDEQVCVPNDCHPAAFQCSNGKCISRAYVCYGGDQCGDNSDEQHCNASYNCHRAAFQCLNGKCISPVYFCATGDNCEDNSDERYCNIDSTVACPPGWIRCPSGDRCIPSGWLCDGLQDCKGESEETNCGKNTTITTTNTSESSQKYSAAKADLKSWFLRRRRPGSRTDRWGSQVHRMAVALHLADNSTFSPGKSTGEEIRYELTTQLLQRFRKDKKMSAHELALYIHALLVSCVDPRDFYGEDLVRQLRDRVEASENYTNPFLVLVLCNAGHKMTNRDVERVSAAYDSQHRPFWTEYQAISTLALSCISSSGGLSVDERVLKDMLQELKRRQFRNGTVDNFRTTALVTQAVFIQDSYTKDFDLDSALRVLTDGLNGSQSVLDAYYALPALYLKSLLNVTSGHCRKEPIAEEDALQKVLDVTEGTINVHYSVWMGDEINVGRTWRLRMHGNSTIYNAIETVAKIDNRQKVKYNVVDGKPYVAALNGKEDDPEMGMFWFVYLKYLSSDKDPKIVEESPVDIKLQPNQEIILWYKRAPWSGQSLMQKPVTSS